MAIPWAPSPWLRRLLVALQWLLGIAGAVALFAGVTVGLLRGFDGHWLLAVALAWCLLFVNIALHELGHALAARAAGMHLARAQIGLVEMVGRRRRWDWRWKRPLLKVDGLVIAFPASARPLRRQQLPFVLGGPLANLATAVVVGTFALVGWPAPFAWIAAGLALHATALGLANLVPAMHGPAASDGMQLVRLLHGDAAQAPALDAFARLNGLSVEGVTADRLPADLLAALETDPAIAPAACWFAAWAALLRHDWDGVIAAQAEAEVRIASDGGAHWAVIAAVLATLSALARALRDGRSAEWLDAALPDDFDWYEPGLRHACRALQAALSGDVAGRGRWLAALRHAIGDSRDLASAATFAALADAIAAFAPAPDPGACRVSGEGDAAASAG